MVDVIIEFCKQLKAQEHGTLVRNGSNRASKAGADRIQINRCFRGAPSLRRPHLLLARIDTQRPPRIVHQQTVVWEDAMKTRQTLAEGGRGKKCNREHGSAW